MLGLVLTLTLAAPIDAPLQLSLHDVDRRMFEVEARASNARVAKGIGLVAVVLGSMSGVGYINGAVSSAIVGLDPLRPNTTPLLVGALIGLSMGLAATFFGIHLGAGAEADRAELERVRAAALADLERAAQSAWARLDETQPAPAPERPLSALTPPPLPAPEPGPRRPLVPRR